MDLATLIGFLAAAGIILLAIILGGEAGVFFNIPSLLVVGGGTIGAVLMQFSVTQFFGAMKVGMKALFYRLSSNKDVNLKMELILFPEYQFIPVFARVVDCRKKMDDNLYRFNIAVDFVGICENDQEIIIQHVLSRQARLLKKERAKKSTEADKLKVAVNG